MRTFFNEHGLVLLWLLWWPGSTEGSKPIKPPTPALTVGPRAARLVWAAAFFTLIGKSFVYPIRWACRLADIKQAQLSLDEALYDQFWDSYFGVACPIWDRILRARYMTFANNAALLCRTLALSVLIGGIGACGSPVVAAAAKATT